MVHVTQSTDPCGLARPLERTCNKLGRVLDKWTRVPGPHRRNGEGQHAHRCRDDGREAEDRRQAQARPRQGPDTVRGSVVSRLRGTVGASSIGPGRTGTLSLTFPHDEQRRHPT